MIYTLASYDTGREHESVFADQRRAAWSGTQGFPVALFAVVLGGRHQVLEFTRYESLQQWQEERLGKESDAIVLSPLTRRLPDTTIAADDPGIYTMRTFGVARENIQRFVEVSESGWWPWVLQVQGVQPLGQWLSISAPQTRVYMMARYENMAHWEATRQVGPRPEDPGLVSLWETASACISERASLMDDTSMCFMKAV